MRIPKPLPSRFGRERTEVKRRDMFTAFLGRGYLPEVVPPILSTSQWAETIDLDRTAVSLPKKSDLTRIAYNCTKRANGRRYFDIIHPASAVATAAWTSRHWDAASTFCNAQNTTPIPLTFLDQEGKRPIPTCSFDKVLDTVKRQLAPARFVVRADISRYYPSIYTHSIPWALHGKEKSKRDRDRSSADAYGNGLDWAVRIGQGNQTKGVPIGPDVSRLVGEIIGAAVDSSMKERCANVILGYVRNVDDFYIGSNTLSDAEAILHGLRECLREFELELGDDKTRITETYRFFDEDWIFELEALVEGSGLDRVRSIERAFDRAFYHAYKYGADSSLKYLIKTVDKFISDNTISFESIQHHLIRSFVNFPHSIDYSLLLFMKQVAVDGDFAQGQWVDAIGRELLRHIELAHDHEVCWLVTAAVAAQIRLPTLRFSLDPRRQISNTFLLLAQDEGLLNMGDQDLFSYSTDENLVIENWLLSNEILKRSWASTNIRRNVRAATEALVGKEVSFFNLDFEELFASELRERAIDDRYHRYDDGEKEPTDNDDDIEF